MVSSVGESDRSAVMSVRACGAPSKPTAPVGGPKRSRFSMALLFLDSISCLKAEETLKTEARKASTSNTITVQWAAPADNGCPMTGCD